MELGEADFGTGSPPRGVGRWRHGGDKAQHEPRRAEPDRPVTQDSPGVARPGEGRLRVIGEDVIPPFPDVVDLFLENQPLARLRDCSGMHENAMPGRVMKSLRDFMETKPKNISFSEDNGAPMPTGARLDIKIYPRDSAVHYDRQHGWSRKWSWALWPLPHMPGMWHWSAIETSLQVGHMLIFPADARPILLASYVCPTDWYKGAQHACSTHQVQTGRQHLRPTMHTCPTCVSFASAPPRETGRTHSSDEVMTCPTSTNATLLWAGPTEHPPNPTLKQQPARILPTGTSPAPSRRPQPVQTLPGRWPSYSIGAKAWDKIPRLGEAKNPGPEPPRELHLDRKNGQRDPIRLCTQKGG